ncbi:hypothetical protein CoNPh11_CDS0043 [Staphylococcus phage S-CoN_Ph11]|nr:hypothetical protein CoNPh3_CDS0017 [Staphylococcus phage S-CoN_Ph3]WNM52031.1 hypothetical protein CoNPh4_CDS0156 [Staphylococcus phage S-CoN_Ph4]WNM52209.1 hypothetical protein CoNPh5_CDS0164 [Staphylococcus phage S-CoN_Ph5]WNM52390.1 hypothetical protein CoNPh7_CDS0017 [Staphylococcus phage S-CoN_Ph7]WNM53101.1 hypothetical protein CoNPh11_CDS0043 [Staphylococcus phage S-CoN_Ph11]WNM54179.1 hypothetical protein CoNPh16_CDS0165 [Staphylococcus phage S-CoN_Ph16]
MFLLFLFLYFPNIKLDFLRFLFLPLRFFNNNSYPVWDK